MKKYLLLWIVLFGLHTTYSQTKLVDKAEKEFDQKAYASVNADNLFNTLVENKFGSAAVYAKLGDSYYFNGDYENAVKAYDYADKLEDEYAFTSGQLFRYSQSLKSVKRYSEATRFIKQLNLKKGNESLNSSIDYLKDIQDQSNRYAIKPVTANSNMPDYGTAFFNNDHVIFTSARDTIGKKYRDAWTGKPYFKLYEATISNGDLIDPKKLTGKINSVYHQSTPVITSDGKFMFFTRSNIKGNKLKSDKSNINHLRIYRATLVDGVWDKIEDLSINNDSYSNAHPALTPDDRKMIFASDRPGSLGQTDLYEVEIKIDGTFGEPRNLGPSINTIGRETFPFITKSGQLYFSSDGQPGLGGLDVFATVKNNDNSYSVTNVGEPINSGDDDFGFVINDEKKGFFSSNRSKNDQIYSLTEFQPVKEIDKTVTVIGKTFDATTGDPLPDVKITVYDKDNRVVDIFYTDNAGEYMLKIPVGDHTIKYEKPGYISSNDVISSKSGSNGVVTINKTLKIDPNATKFPADGSGSISNGDNIVVKPIYFDLNGTKIKKSSMVEMNKIVKILKNYPTSTIDVKSHTDSQGNNEYNLKLSERRAQATIKYLVSKGIRPARVTGKGYGETELLNNCADGVKCSDSEHEINRRSEFIIQFHNKD
ncbi:OmpA family protein [Flavobacterium sp. N1736]|uniref:OmpA family protein n=1 Tax=Flavobacterium sp. N1736 TaxID=2986823 RepID=UPI0029CAC6F2|nr:OmpA family protein [Flavobacterium sp. N1736]